ncbi:SMI1/KNR4 family protein [Deinococcus aquaedulcis]|uniref:SMI1/KNR4 family protein n=1 Tax=Deinococcus aquaedulcis TaxID=2840455 RepID=UPI001C82840B|nr:SMI1/KNR4 family protein [Deinococcus aquaedulcis]
MSQGKEVWRLLRIELEAIAALRGCEPHQRLKGAGSFLQVEPRLHKEALFQIQEQMGIELPDSYAHFLTEFGNGFSSNNYQIGQILPLEEVLKYSVGNKTADFPHVIAWTPDIDDTSVQLQPGEPDKRNVEHWMDWYFDDFHLSGSLRIEDIGCGYFRQLVVSGPGRNQLWEDNRAADCGIVPTTWQGAIAEFSSYYENAVSRILKDLRGRA